MHTIRSMAVAATVLLVGALVATPAPASASECGGAYVACLYESGALGSSDQLHEVECYGEYLDCIRRQLRSL